MHVGISLLKADCLIFCLELCKGKAKLTDSSTPVMCSLESDSLSEADALTVAAFRSLK